MSETAERLRDLARDLDQAGHERGADLAREAADEIDRLQEQLAYEQERCKNNAGCHAMDVAEIRAERDQKTVRCEQLEAALRTARKNARDQYGMTLRKFATFCGVSAAEISRWIADPIDQSPDLVCRR